MTQNPGWPEPPDGPSEPGAQGPAEQPAPEQPGYDPSAYPQPDPSYSAPGYYAQQPGYGPPGGYAPGGYAPPSYGYDPNAPYGIDPKTGIPFSDKSKLIAGLIQILLPLGIGRMYMGQNGLGIAQLLVTVLTCGIGAIWPFVDGFIILLGDQRDPYGRPLRS